MEVNQFAEREGLKDMVLFFLEQIALAALVVTFCSCVLGNGMSLDHHFRGGLGATLIGLAYIAGHAVYLSTQKLPDLRQTLGVASTSGYPAAEDYTRVAQSTSEPKSIGFRSNPGFPSIFPNDTAGSSGSVLIEPTGEYGYASEPPAVNSRPFGSGNVTITQGGMGVGVGVAADSAPMAMAASAQAGGGSTLGWSAIYQGSHRLSRTNQPVRHYGPGPRTLTEAQIQNAIHVLTTKTRRNVLIVTITGSNDAPVVAEQLTEAFSVAGWDVFIEATEARFIDGINVKQGIHFVGPNLEHESMQMAFDAFKDTPATPKSMLPMPWKMVIPSSERPQFGPPLTIVIGAP